MVRHDAYAHALYSLFLCTARGETVWRRCQSRCQDEVCLHIGGRFQSIAQDGQAYILQLFCRLGDSLSRHEQGGILQQGVLRLYGQELRLSFHGFV